MSDHTTKTCTKCKGVFPATAEFFGSDKTKRDSLHSWCRACARDYDRTRNKTQSRKESMSRNAKLRYASHKSEYIERAKQWRIANPEKRREISLRYFHGHKDKYKVNGRRWWTNNPEKQYAKSKRFRLKHPNYWRMARQKSKALKRQLPSTLTTSEWEQIKAEWGFACAYCGKSWMDCKLAQEHVIPVIQGGPYIADNIVPACKSCNSKKGGRTPEQAGMKLRDRHK